MVLFESLTAEFEWKGYTIKVDKPDAEVQSAWISRGIVLATAAGLPADEVKAMASDIADCVTHINGDAKAPTKAKILASTSPIDIAEFWGAILEACRVSDPEKKGSEKAPRSPVTQNVTTTAEDAPTRSSSTETAGTNSKSRPGIQIIQT